MMAVLLSLPSSSHSDSEADFNSDLDAKSAQDFHTVETKAEKACRCVDDPMQIEDLETTESKPTEKQDKVFSSLWKPSNRQGAVGIVATLFNVHSKEALPVLKGQFPPKEVLDFFFRCRGFGTVLHLDERLVENAVLAAVHFKSQRIEVISGYRSPKFNDALSKKGRHVAGESKHSMGGAMDFRLAGKDAATVGNWLEENFDGGVGIYVEDNFVHIDTGERRRWRGR
jgi:hypothetical protein